MEVIKYVVQEVGKISEEDVQESSTKIKKGKTVGPDGITVEVWNCLGEMVVRF